MKTNNNEGMTGVVCFATEVARYFMDFLETDFHKVRHPKRYFQNRNSNNLQTGISLNKYKKYNALVWKTIKNGFDDECLKNLKRGVHVNPIPESLLNLIQQQISAISSEEIKEIISLFSNEINLGLSKHPKDTPAATVFALDSINRIIREKFLAVFIEKIREPLDKLKTAMVDSIYQIEEELTNILVAPLEDTISSIITQKSIGKTIEITILFSQVFSLNEVQNKLESFFKGFATGDLFFEVSEIFNNKNLLEKQEFYLYFCDIKYNNITYPLFYIPLQIEKTSEGFAFTFDSLLYINKKAIQFISQNYNAQTERKGSLSHFLERIIYLAEKDKRQHLLGIIDQSIKEAIHYFGLYPYLDLHNPERQVAKSPAIQITNSCYLALFDKSDESLVNDYEELLEKLKLGDNSLAIAFQSLLDDFITHNPISVIAEVERDWEQQKPSEKLAYASPIPLNEEQRQILLALNKPNCKYITVEGPPGTGKSHTITAIACDAILKNMSVLILSDKKEALDVVESKITETMNKVRIDNEFQNPILRLGKAGNTYSKILSTTSMEHIKEHYKAVRTEYQSLESNISGSVESLKKDIENNIAIHGEITLPDIFNFIKLEFKFSKARDLPFDFEEINDDEHSKENILNLRNKLELLNNALFPPESILDNLFQSYYELAHGLTNFRNFINFLSIAENLNVNLPEKIQHIFQLKTASSEGLLALETYLSECEKIKSTWLGYFLKGRKIKNLNQQLERKLSHHFQHPQKQLPTIKSIVSFFREATQLKKSKEISSSFEFEKDFIESLHQLITLKVKIPSSDERKNILENLASIEKLFKHYPKTAEINQFTCDDIFSLKNNKLLQYPYEQLEQLTQYLNLKTNLHDIFLKIPRTNYISSKKHIEELVTTQMTYKMDERVINFFENHRNDAKTLAGIISKKQQFDKLSFEKLKNAFPCILSGIRDFAEYIPLTSELFDIIIIDEASQVSIAQAFPALLRGKKILVLGDKKQFSNVKSSHARSDTNREYLNRLREVFTNNISNEPTKIERLGKFDIKTSILDFFERISNYSIMLKKHFRGYRELISYSSKYFYNNSLQAIKIRAKSMNNVIRFTLINHDGKIELVPNTNQLEIQAILAEVELLTTEEPSSSIGIITPHTNQQKLLFEAFSKHPKNEHFEKQHQLKIMTFDTCQGEERDIILYSMVANPISDKLWGIFIKDRNSVDLEEGGQIKLQRLNVGFSRAKERMHFFLSKQISDFTGSIGEALQHYKNNLDEAKKLPSINDTDPRSAMEKKVLHWIQETEFFKLNRSAIELQTQFPLGKYIQQLDQKYSHPAYVVDFLFIYTDANNKQHKIIIEYDGFEFHFSDHANVNEFNYEKYYTEKHVYREKVLESYGYNFLRINRFNLGKDPIETLNHRFFELIKKKDHINHSLVETIHHNIDGLQTGRMKECGQCNQVKNLEHFKDIKLITGYGRYCKNCKENRENIQAIKTKSSPNLVNIKCPKCNAPMQLCRRKRDNRKFYGCSKYPTCYCAIPY